MEEQNSIQIHCRKSIHFRDSKSKKSVHYSSVRFAFISNKLQEARQVIF